MDVMFGWKPLRTLARLVSLAFALQEAVAKKRAENPIVSIDQVPSNTSDELRIFLILRRHLLEVRYDKHLDGGFARFQSQSIFLRRFKY
jgi:hypothetical protein